jgi:hypothetical protein
MLAFDLSSTPLARSDELGLVPTDSELCAIVNALLSVKRSSMDGLFHGALILDDQNIDEVAQAMHAEFPLLFQRATNLDAIRRALDWYVGLTVFRHFDGAYS